MGNTGEKKRIIRRYFSRLDRGWVKGGEDKKDLEQQLAELSNEELI